MENPIVPRILSALQLESITPDNLRVAVDKAVFPVASLLYLRDNPEFAVRSRFGDEFVAGSTLVFGSDDEHMQYMLETARKIMIDLRASNMASDFDEYVARLSIGVLAKISEVSQEALNDAISEAIAEELNLVVGISPEEWVELALAPVSESMSTYKASVYDFFGRQLTPFCREHDIPVSQFLVSRKMSNLERSVPLLREAIQQNQPERVKEIVSTIETMSFSEVNNYVSTVRKTQRGQQRGVAYTTLASDNKMYLVVPVDTDDELRHALLKLNRQALSLTSQDVPGFTVNPIVEMKELLEAVEWHVSVYKDSERLQRAYAQLKEILHGIA